MNRVPSKIYVSNRRMNDASKLNFSVNSVIQIVVWVLSLAAAVYGVQIKLSEIQTDIKVIATQMEGDTKLADKDNSSRDARIRELEVTNKAFEIRIRTLETQLARLGGK